MFWAADSGSQRSKPSLERHRQDLNKSKIQRRCDVTREDIGLLGTVIHHTHVYAGSNIAVDVSRALCRSESWTHPCEYTSKRLKAMHTLTTCHVEDTWILRQHLHLTARVAHLSNVTFSVSSRPLCAGDDHFRHPNKSPKHFWSRPLRAYPLFPPSPSLPPLRRFSWSMR